MSDALDGIFHEVTELPNPNLRRLFERLVGLDEVKDRLLKEARILLKPKLLEDWSRKHYSRRIALVEIFADRPPLFIFGGDVGTGKTALADSFGDKIARDESIPVTLFRLSLSTRGSGAVGEMTRLITAAFKEVRDSVNSKHTKSHHAAVFVIDEADALAQSRELAQMHHEDWAGVNALIRGLDDFATEKLPVIVVMCTNRLDAIDPAVRRRAAATFEFARPNLGQRAQVLGFGLEGTKLSDEQIHSLAAATGPSGARQFGFTYSDLTQRLLPGLLLDAFPSRAIDYDRALCLAQQMVPTPPFRGDTAES
jgi:AAA+ superfamily predicted ATPase